MAKPTSAVVLAILVLAAWLASGNPKVGRFTSACLVALILWLSASYVLAGSPSKYIADMLASATSADLLEGGEKLSRLLITEFPEISNGLLSLVTVFFMFHVILRLVPKLWMRQALVLAVTPPVLIISLFQLIGRPLVEINVANLSFVFLAPILAHVPKFVRCVRAGQAEMDIRERLVLAATLSMFPLAYSFGTNNSLWLNAGFASIFWFAAAILFTGIFASDDDNNASLIVTASVAVTAITLGKALEYPYRQSQPVFEMSAQAHTGNGILVAKTAADYLDSISAIAKLNDFAPATPMIDLTGHYPGTLFFLGAKAIGAPWLLGGYVGSDIYAERHLSRVPCDELAVAWLLIEPAGPRHLPFEVVSRLGLGTPENFTVLGKVMSPVGSYPDRYEQYLLKPFNQNAARLACEKARGPAG